MALLAHDERRLPGRRKVEASAGSYRRRSSDRCFWLQGAVGRSSRRSRSLTPPTEKPATPPISRSDPTSPSSTSICRAFRASNFAAASLQRDPEARLIIFSMNDDPVFAARAIEAGAKGYIAKNDDPLLFAEAVRRVGEGGVYLRPEVAREVAFIRVGSGPNQLSSLSARDLEILRLLAAGNSMAEIAHVLNVSYKTVANNCTALKHKLGARSAMDLMRIAVGAADLPAQQPR